MEVRGLRHGCIEGCNLAEKILVLFGDWEVVLHGRPVYHPGGTGWVYSTTVFRFLRGVRRFGLARLPGYLPTPNRIFHVITFGLVVVRGLVISDEE